MINRKIRILLYGSNLWYLGAGLLGPLFAVFTESIGGDILDIVWAWSVYLLVTGILIIIIGNVSDEKKRKEKLMVIGFVINAVFSFAYLLVSSPFHLLFVEAGLGVAVALATPTYDALYSLYGDRKQKGYEWGLQDGEEYIFSAIGVIIGGFIVTYFGFRTLFVLMGIIQIIAAFSVAKIIVSTRQLK
ncbi:hypothetical protein A2567_00020 [Candidatus Azambacteria bacterium RIFOXYD1_FULL_42_11]|uniref:Major facilitator superfamily (MFS) profile domain-containing protein n=1 Tax=Candidatus Azambacteria bacterium RIFOXYD1_FULL_42_11 TaxID=1797310 RepID=A0A1F5CGF8_9BACT|nr:MAG: hypothetical protein A2567_00020 [Candidatus Azambacteria bacterium RIFOXYD1_FULL_42_11]